MKINYVQADCGAGKTYQALAHIAANPGRYVFAVNKIDLIQERIREFLSLPGSSQFIIEQRHSRYPLAVAMSVGSAIQTFTNTANGQARAVLLFVTHESLKVADWSDYGGWRLFIDEVPNAWTYVERNFKQSFDFVRKHFRADPYANLKDHHRLSLTREGRDICNTWDGDDLVEVLKPLLDRCNKSEVVLINRHAWDKPKAHKFKAFCLFEPNALERFQEVTILANRFTDSLLYHCWSRLGVQFDALEGMVFRTPAAPVSERLKVVYFSRRDATFAYFRGEDDPLRRIADWCRVRLGAMDAYYTVNDKFLQNFRFDGQTRIEPLAHGHNGLRDKQVGIFMAAMKGKPHEYATVKQAFGVEREDLDRAREYEALYQFVMRSNLRDYASNQPVVMYVFSQRQAEYLRAVSGCTIEFEDIGLNGVVNKGGRPKKKR